MQVAKKPLLRIEAEEGQKGIVFRPEGALAPVAKPIIQRINQVFADEKPIRSEPDRLIFSTWIPPAPSEAFDRMISSQVAAITRRRIPDQFSIAISRRCPNNCIHCSAPRREGDVLSKPLIKRAIDESLEMGSYMITFDGGEPMLRKDLPELIYHVDDRAISTAFTSGYGLTEDLAVKLKQAGLYAVRISIDSPHKEEHDRVRGRSGAFLDALQGARNALSAGLLVDLFMVTSPSNIDHIEDAYSLASELGVHELSLYEIVAVGRWADHTDEVLSAEDVDRLVRFHKEKNGLQDGPRVSAFPYILSPEMFGCFAGRRWFHIDASGEALPCAYIPISFGNINDMSLREIWKKMGRNKWLKGKCDGCLMKDQAFRDAYFKIIEGSGLL
jgi:MoaA/NifB/PqqE/SkfB family radical SAM enzyme